MWSGIRNSERRVQLWQEGEDCVSALHCARQGQARLSRNSGCRPRESNLLTGPFFFHFQLSFLRFPPNLRLFPVSISRTSVMRSTTLAGTLAAAAMTTPRGLAHV